MESTRKYTYLQAYEAGYKAFLMDADDPASHTNQGESNRWTDYRDDYLLVLGLSSKELDRLYSAFRDGYRDASDKEPG
jgi:hypothetical protein